MEAFRILPGLPATGPWPEQFSPTGRGTHREGLVVEFNPGTSSSWIGNSQPGMTSYDAVIPHPNARSVIVIAHGNAYVIDPKDRRLVERLWGQVDLSVFVQDGRVLVLSNGIRLQAMNETGTLWKSRRISWDGIADLREVDGMLHGQSWDEIDDCGVPFTVDLCTGEVTGGAYPRDLPD